MRQSNHTHKESIASNLGQYCFEKDSKAFQEPNDDAAILCAEYIKEVGTPKVVVELGCGDGASLRKFQEMGFTTIGVDINTEKLEHATGELFHSDMLDYLKATPDESLDNVFMHHSLEHVIDVESILNEISRVIKKGGVYFCITPADDEPHTVHHTAFDSPDELAPPDMNCIKSIKQERFGHPEYLYIGTKR